MQSPLLNTTDPASVVHHVLSGSFRSLSLFLLAFSPLHRTLSLVQRVDAFGPHQYLATTPRKDRVYTTSWALPPLLSSWEIQRSDDGPWRVHHIDNVPIIATSSYITIPPPYTHAYSAGGPTGEVHSIDPTSGAFGTKVQQILFVPEHELEKADKTRVALRYGSHGFEFSPATDQAFVPVVGTNTIEMYARDPDRTNIDNRPVLTHVASVPSPRGPGAHDGPRHVKVHPNGKVLYCVTEHSNLVDAYRITRTSLTYLASRSLLPAHLRSKSHAYRGDTLLFSPPTPSRPSPRTLFTTTRGSTPSQNGYLGVFALDAEGLFVEDEGKMSSYYETPTSGGKANAIDVLPNTLVGAEAVWILLTDDDEAAVKGGNGVRVLEWEGWGKGVKEVVGWPGQDEKKARDEGDGEVWMEGGSHAIWLD